MLRWKIKNIGSFCFKKRVFVYWILRTYLTHVPRPFYSKGCWFFRCCAMFLSKTEIANWETFFFFPETHDSCHLSKQAQRTSLSPSSIFQAFLKMIWMTALEFCVLVAFCVRNALLSFKRLTWGKQEIEQWMTVPNPVLKIMDCWGGSWSLAF